MSELEMMEKRYLLLGNLKSFNSTSLIKCRAMVIKAISMAREGKFDRNTYGKGTAFLDEHHKLVKKATDNLNILGQIERMKYDLEVIRKENK